MLRLSQGKSLRKGCGSKSAESISRCGSQLEDQRHFSDKEKKQYGYASSFRRDPLRSIVVPSIQEFALKSVPNVKRRTKRKDNQLLGDIQEEMESISLNAEELLEVQAADDESWSRGSDVTSSSSEEISDARNLWEDDESERERERKRRNRARDAEQNFGHILVSFIPIPW